MNNEKRRYFQTLINNIFIIIPDTLFSVEIQKEYTFKIIHQYFKYFLRYFKLCFSHITISKEPSSLWEIEKEINCLINISLKTTPLPEKSYVGKHGPIRIDRVEWLDSLNHSICILPTVPFIFLPNDIRICLPKSCHCNACIWIQRFFHNFPLKFNKFSLFCLSRRPMFLLTDKRFLATEKTHGETWLVTHRSPNELAFYPIYSVFLNNPIFQPHDWNP